MGEAVRAAYENGAGGGARGGARGDAVSRMLGTVGAGPDKRITVEEFKLRIGAVRTRRVNAEAAYLHHENLDFGGGWTTKGHAKLYTEVLEARSEELRLVHLLLGEQYGVEVLVVNGEWRTCLVAGGGA